MTQLSYDNIFDAITDNESEAADLRFRADLMLTLRSIFEAKEMKPAEISAILGVPQPRVSELMRGKVQLFSADKLIGFLAKMDVRLRPSFSEEQENVVCDVMKFA